MSEQGELNIEQAAATLAGELGFGSQEDPPVTGGDAEAGGGAPPSSPPAEPPADAAAKPTTQHVAQAPRSAPKSWKKDMHEAWGKIDPASQDYIEQREREMLDGLGAYKEHNDFGRVMKEAITPYMPIIQAQGIEPAKAVQALLNAHYRLTQGAPEARLAAYHELGRNLGLVAGHEPSGAEADPAFRAAMERLGKLEGALNERQQQQFQEVHARVTNDVNAFADAKDEKGNLTHPYFTEVADDILVFLKSGAELEDAYDRAVYANPVTRAKEIARKTAEAQSEAQSRANAEAAAALKAKQTNVRSRDTKTAPTEPLGKMEDTMRETLRDIRSRTAH